MYKEHAISELRKDADQESLLLHLNERLAKIEDDLEAKCTRPEKPTLFFVGAPRSGKTLTSQLLSFTGAFGYISNFVARFWMAPTMGILLQQALKITENASESNYQSEYGVTKGWAEPHEFGYFWNHWFDVGVEVNKLSAEKLQRVDGAGLSRAIAAMEAAFNAPMIFKNATWCSFQIEFLAHLFPKSIFLFTEREPIFVAQSILMNRQKHLGSKDLWLSMKPREYFELSEMPWWDQIAGQIYYITSEIENALTKIPSVRIVRSFYKDFCQSPEQVVRNVFNAAEAVSGERLELVEPLPSGFKSNEFQRVPDDDFRLLKQACAKYFE